MTIRWLIFHRADTESRILVHLEQVSAVVELGDGTIVLKLANGDQVHVRESWGQLRAALATTRDGELHAVEARSVEAR